jgi:hypothetical protein
MILASRKLSPEERFFCSKKTALEGGGILSCYQTMLPCPILFCPKNSSNQNSFILGLESLPKVGSYGFSATCRLNLSTQNQPF